MNYTDRPAISKSRGTAYTDDLFYGGTFDEVVNVLIEPFQFFDGLKYLGRLGKCLYFHSVSFLQLGACKGNCSRIDYLVNA